MDTTTTRMDAAARYRKEAARLREAVETRGDLSPKERQQMKTHLWKTKMLMRSMAAARRRWGLTRPRWRRSDGQPGRQMERR